MRHVNNTSLCRVSRGPGCFRAQLLLSVQPIVLTQHAGNRASLDLEVVVIPSVPED